MKTHEHKIVLETERLYLREISNDDSQLLHEIFSDAETMRYYPKTLDKDETIAWIEKVVKNYEKYGAGMWACHLKSTDEFVGHIGLHFHDNVDGQFEVEVGYLLLRQHWHKGYATEAAKASLKYGREKLGYQRIISLIRPENLPSRSVAERNGLTIEKEIEYKNLRCFVYLWDGN